MTPVKARFGDLLAEPLRNGVYKPKEYHGRGAKVINMKELFAYERIDDQATDRVYLEPDELARVRVKPGDLLFARRSFVLEGAGKCSIIGKPSEDTTFESSMIRARLDTNKALPQFMYYLFASSFGRAAMASIATRTAVSGITGKSLQELMLPLPPVPIQSKIAAILCAHDNLIDNSNLRIRLLEETAQRIYREWFVDFRYPGHEDVPLVDSELGPIPQGWSIGRVGDHATVIRGRSYRGVDVVAEGGIPFINLKCVARDGGFRPDGIKRYVGEFKDVQKVHAGDIVMAVTDMTQERRIVARAARVPDISEEFGIFSMDLVKIVPKDLPAEYLLGLLRYSKFPDQVKAYANGANVLHLHPDRISDYCSSFPLLPIARLYSDQIAPTQHLSDVLQAANERLRATRDLLLPRLISGEIDVTDLSIVMPEEAA